MKKIILILCLLPILAFSQVSYKIIADSTILKSISTNSNELVIRNSTKDTTTSVLYNNGNGVTQFKKVRNIRLNDSTYVIKIGTTVIGDTLKIKSTSNGSNTYAGNGLTKYVDTIKLGGRTTQSQTIVSVGSPINNPIGGVATIWTDTPTRPTVSIECISDDFSFLTGYECVNFNTLDIEAAQIGSFDYNSSSDLDDNKLMFLNNNGSKETYLIGLPTDDNADQIVVRDSATNRLYIANSQRLVEKYGVTSVGTGVGLSGGTITGSGTIIADTTLLSTKGNVTGLVNTKQNILVSGTSIKTVNSTSLLGSGNITTPDAQTLSTTFASDSISLGISGGNTIKFAYAVDSVSVVSDSLITIKAGTRKSYPVGSSGGGSLSALTSAVATNTINNTNYKQRYNWSTLAGDTAFVMTSNSTGAASNLQNVLCVSQSGANATASQSTYALKVSNKKTGTSSLNYAGYFEASGGSANYAGVFDGQILSLSGGYKFTSGGAITEGGGLSIASGASRAIFLQPAIAEGVDIYTASGNISHNFYEISGTRSGIVFGGRYTSGLFEPFSGTTIALIRRDTGKLKLCAGTSISSGFTPFDILTVQGSTTQALGNVGIGTTAPVASAKLEISSSTMGFLPPRMTTTERDAISSPAEGLIIYNLTTHKLNVYTGSAWEAVTSL